MGYDSRSRLFSPGLLQPAAGRPPGTTGASEPPAAVPDPGDPGTGRGPTTAGVRSGAGRHRPRADHRLLSARVTGRSPRHTACWLLPYLQDGYC